MSDGFGVVFLQGYSFSANIDPHASDNELYKPFRRRGVGERYAIGELAASVSLCCSHYRE